MLFALVVTGFLPVWFLSKTLIDLSEEELTSTLREMQLTHASAIGVALDETVDAWAAQIVECAPLSVKAIKECVKETLDLPVSEAMAMRLPALVAALESEDSEEGPRAFQEKRKPEWKGR